MRQNVIMLVFYCFILLPPPTTRARSHLTAPEPVYRPGGHYISTSTPRPPKKALENELGANPIDGAGLKEEIEIHSGVEPEFETEAMTKAETEMELEPKPVGEEISKEENEINRTIESEFETETMTKLATMLELVTKQTKQTELELTVTKSNLESQQTTAPQTEVQSSSSVTQQPHTTKPVPPLREDITNNKVSKLPRPPRTPRPPPPSSETQFYATSTTKATTPKVLKLPTPPRIPLPPPAPKQLFYRTSTTYLLLLFAQKQIEFTEVSDRDVNLYQWREYT
ncbi:mucin-2-like [Anastrepha ludens]|uniref:mucin-2-like n=1 Tax=Anastrepha ludens TaxID=28586 RepID=UPI0023B0BC14|nr:mucin-2-like [Anastrepha ludens]